MWRRQEVSLVDRKREFRESWSGAEKWPQGFNPRVWSLEEQVWGLLLRLLVSSYIFKGEFCHLILLMYCPVQALGPEYLTKEEPSPLCAFLCVKSFCSAPDSKRQSCKALEVCKFIVSSSLLLLHLSLWVTCLCLTAPLPHCPAMGNALPLPPGWNFWELFQLIRGKWQSWVLTLFHLTPCSCSFKYPMWFSHKNAHHSMIYEIKKKLK